MKNINSTLLCKSGYTYSHNYRHGVAGDITRIRGGLYYLYIPNGAVLVVNTPCGSWTRTFTADDKFLLDSRDCWFTVDRDTLAVLIGDSVDGINIDTGTTHHIGPRTAVLATNYVSAALTD